jgi:Domain of unknown function (DUF2804), C-terminal
VHQQDTPQLSHRGRFGEARSLALSGLALSPAPMPSHRAGRPLKAWRYVGVYGPELMLCAASVRIGRGRESFWALWDRAEHRYYQGVVLGLRGPVTLVPGAASVRDRDVRIDLELAETAGVETVSATAGHYAWTRKQGGVRVCGTVWIDGRERPLDARAVIDDTAGYHPRHTRWRWSAGVGTANRRPVAWNLVEGLNDAASGSERTVWIDGEPSETPPSRFAVNLASVDELCFHPEAELRNDQNLLLVRSRYRQLFGTFSGALPGGLTLTEGYGVMEHHDVWW